MADKIQKDTVLIIEDEKPLNDILRDNFIKEGFEVLTAFNGQDGLDKAIKLRPMIILLDILLPALDGMSVLKKIREVEGWGESVPVIILTNVNDSEKITEGMTNKADKYWIKSDVRISELITFARQQLELRKNMQL